jgi:monomeric isocitrate dehydrogenase
MIEDCQKNGQLDPATMGSMSNVGLMAQQAEEYGSHARTFHMEAAGSVRIVDTDGRELLTQSVSEAWDRCAYVSTYYHHHTIGHTRLMSRRLVLL